MASVLNATLSAGGLLSVGLNSVPWLSSGAVVIRSEAQWYSSDCASLKTTTRACKPLLPGPGLQASSGTDAIGAYTEQALAWFTNSGMQAKPIIWTGVRSYADMADVKVLTQSFPQGLKPKNKLGKKDEIVTAFPTLKQSHLDLGVLFFEGVQCQNTRFFRWNSGTAWASDDFTQGRKGKMNDDGAAMPLLLTAADGSTLLASPLVDFFTSVQTASLAVGNFSIGMQGDARHARQKMFISLI